MRVLTQWTLQDLEKLDHLGCLGRHPAPDTQFWSCWPLWPAVLWGRPSAALNCGSPTQIPASSRSAAVRRVLGRTEEHAAHRCIQAPCMVCLTAHPCWVWESRGGWVAVLPSCVVPD